MRIPVKPIVIIQTILNNNYNLLIGASHIDE